MQGNLNSFEGFKTWEWSRQWEILVVTREWQGLKLGIMQIASAKSQSARGATPYLAFMGNCPTISHTC